MEEKSSPNIGLIAVVIVVCVIVAAGLYLLWFPGEEPVKTTVTVSASKDNTLIENETGLLSNALGESLYVGRTNQGEGQSIRRGLIEFDLTGKIPEGAEIESVELVLYLVKSQDINSTVSIHKATSEWGEGTSEFSGGSGAPATIGDATWLYPFYASYQWVTPGGDYVAAASASVAIAASSSGNTTWNTTGMLSDVQAWLDDPTSNHGWLLKGDETVPKTSMQFASKDNTEPGYWPRLKVTYTE